MRARIYQGLGYIIIFYTRTTLNTDFLKTLLALFTCRCMGGSNINEDLSKQLLIQKALENAACKADVLIPGGSSIPTLTLLSSRLYTNLFSQQLQ
jgi:hypothetical protein